MSFFDPFNPPGSGGGGEPGESNLVRGGVPPGDTTKSWHNTTTGELYTYDTDGWYSGIKQITDINRGGSTANNGYLKINDVTMALGRGWKHVNANNLYVLERVYWSSASNETGEWAFSKNDAPWFSVAVNSTKEGNTALTPTQSIAANEVLTIQWSNSITGGIGQTRFWIDYKLKYITP